MDWDPRYLYRQLFVDDKQGMERFLEEVQFMEWNARQDGGRSFEVAVAELSTQFPHYADLIHAYDLRWEESINGPIQPTIEIMRTLRDSGYPLYGLSNWSAEKFMLVRHKYEFFRWFEDIILSGEVKLSKPDPRIFVYTLERIGRGAETCLLIDDSLQNIAAANAMGFQTIHFQSPGQLAAELSEMGIEVTKVENSKRALDQA